MRLFKVLFIVVLFPIAMVMAVFVKARHMLPDEQELLNYRNATASVVLSRKGELLGKIFTENRTNIEYGQLPVHLVHALVATEDARFYEHRGIDFRSLLRVFFKTMLFNKERSGGGSTITQQLAKNMFGRNYSGPFALLINKTREGLLAQRIEKMFSKEEILTLYFNTVPFGENVFGIEAASRRYFNKGTEKLKIEESAVLVGMLKANHYYNPRLHPENSKNRRNVVLSQMQKYRYLELPETDSLRKLPLRLNYTNMESEGPADYFLYQVKNEARQILKDIQPSTGKEWNIEEDGLAITTTLDLKLQKYANKAFHDHLSAMQKRLNDQYKSAGGSKFLNNLVKSELNRLKLTDRAREVDSRQVFSWSGQYIDSISVADSLENAIQLLHAGLLAIDPVTGAIRAWIGGLDFGTMPFDQVLARRQLGSTFKPILYSAALEGGMEPCYYLDNDSIGVYGYDEWVPENFDRTYGGKYSLAGALVHSMNIPTFNLFLKVGFDNLDYLWRKMGFSFIMDNTPALAMGTAEASILELALAYASFSNGGFRITPHKIVSIKGSDGTIIWKNEFHDARVTVLSASTCQLMNAILQKAVREGTGSALRNKYGVTVPIAGKTGTSQEYADAWFAAYTPALVVVSRVGASLPSVHFATSSNGSGSRLALPLVGMTLRRIQADPELRNQYMVPFPELSPETERELDCPDYREKRFFENLIDILSDDKVTFEKEPERTYHKKESFFKRIFGRKDTAGYEKKTRKPGRKRESLFKRLFGTQE